MTRFRFSLSLAAAVGALVLICAPAAAIPGWSSPLSVFTARFGPAHSMALDSTGHPMIASEGGLHPGIWFTSNQPSGGGGWFNLQLTHKDDAAPSIAVWNDRFYIAFVREDPNNGHSLGLYTATNATGTVVVTKIDSGADYSPSVAVRDGKWSIAFHQAGSQHRLVYLTNAGGSWSSQTVDSSCCHGSLSLRLDSSGRPRIAYSDGSPMTSTGLKYALRTTGGTWSFQTIDTHQVDSPSLVFDPNQRPVIAYTRISQGTWYAARGASSWSVSQVNSQFLTPADVALDAFGSPSIVTGNNGNIQYWTQSGSGWVDTVLTFTHEDSIPEIEKYQGKSKVIFNRESGGTGDGIYFMKQT